MATIRHHARIDRSPDEVWRTVSDAGTVADWFPVIDRSSVDGGFRDCTLVNGDRLREEIVTSDDRLRRFQYRIVGGDMPLDFHLGTVDVIADGATSLVIYSTDLLPDEAGQQMDEVVAEGLRGLKRHLET